MTRDDLLHALQINNVQAFLQVIRVGESSQGEEAYRMIFGGELFDSFADHPRKKVTKGRYTSTAAGAYQFLERTWDGLVKQYGFSDFSPANQDLAAVALIAGRSALQAVIGGQFNAAIQRCSKEWASLPGSTYGQPTQTLAQARRVYEAFGGTYAPAAAFAPVPIATPQEVKPMGPFIIPILSALSSLIPQLGPLFGGTEVANRNIAAGSIIAQKITEATQSVNLQEAAEKIQNDSIALQAAKQAVSDAIYELSEAGGGGIDGARKFAGSFDQLPFHRQGAFWISLILVIMPFMLLADVFYVHPDTYDGNLRTQIVTGVMLIISIIGAFWLGSTFGSQKKDAALAAR